jgi:hypothetical protein
MKNILLVVSILLFFSCGSVKRIKEKRNETYKELDSISLAENLQFFSIDIPKNWFAYVGGHSGFSLSPRFLLKNMEKHRYGSQR